MYPLNRPARIHIDDYSNCVARRRMTSRIRTLLLQATGRISTAYNDYLTAESDASLVRPLTISGSLSRALQSNYKVVRDSGLLAEMRGQLMAAVRNGRCPLCGIFPATTLDHHLPKSRYPEFSIFAPNLVPACDPCNRSKGHKVGLTPADQLLHAYFHRLPDEEVLVARVTLQQTVLVNYEMVQTPRLDADTFKRARYQFTRLKLATSFERATNQELSDRRGELIEVFGPERDESAVRNHLEVAARSNRQSRGLNDWKTALYLALSRHNGFCGGGFELL